MAQEITYLETPARGLVPKDVLDSSINIIKKWEEMDSGADNDELQGSIKAKAARLLKVNKENLALTTCTSHGLSLVANSYPWQKGDNLIVPECEHPNNFYPWAQLRNQGVEVRLAKCKDGVIDAKEIIAKIDSKTRMIALSIVTFYPGGYFDIAELNEYIKDKDIHIVLDAIQAVGFLPLYPRDLKVSAIATAAYKGLMTPYGAGLLYVDDELNKKLVPREVSLSNIAVKKQFPELDYTLIEDVQRLQPMPIHLAGLASMNRALDIILSIGIERIGKRVCSLEHSLKKELTANGVKTVLEPGDPRLKHIVCIEEKNAREVANFAREHGLYLSPRRSGIRMGFHIYNNEKDVMQAKEVLLKYYKK